MWSNNQVAPMDFKPEVLLLLQLGTEVEVEELLQPERADGGNSSHQATPTVYRLFAPSRKIEAHFTLSKSVVPSICLVKCLLLPTSPSFILPSVFTVLFCIRIHRHPSEIHCTVALFAQPPFVLKTLHIWTTSDILAIQYIIVL
jgi:hypothetical protein